MPSPVTLSRIPSVLNSLDTDQAQHFVGPDLGPNCLQKLSADDTSRQTVGMVFVKVNNCHEMKSSIKPVLRGHLKIEK